MTGPASSPRFRIRLDDGSEHPVDSVEALVRCLTGGDVLPDTPIHDASIGDWQDASNAPVVRFILDELVRDGAAIPPGWEQLEMENTDPGVPTASADPLDVGVSVDQLTAEDADEGETPPEVVEPDSQPADEPGDLGDGREREDPWGPEFSARTEPEREESRDARDWLTPSSAGGLFASGPEDGVPDHRREPSRFEGEDPEVLSDADSSGRVPKPPRRRKDDAPIPFEPAGKSRTSVWAWALGLAAGLFLVLGGSYLFSGRGESGVEPATDPTLAVAEEPLVPPSGLEVAVETAAGNVTERFQAAADSLRRAQGLASVPPGIWLSGSYLADAPEYPEARAYFEEYGRLVEEIRLEDRTLFLEVLDSELTSELVEPFQRTRLETYLRARYAQSLPTRRELYDQLGLVSTNALALHDFLVREAEALEHTPAVGPGVPRDPVLEVGTQDEEVQRELMFHLDELFRALDRSRGGGAPTLSGLGDELYGGFGHF